MILELYAIGHAERSRGQQTPHPLESPQVYVACAQLSSLRGEFSDARGPLPSAVAYASKYVRPRKRFVLAFAKFLAMFLQRKKRTPGGKLSLSVSSVGWLDYFCFWIW